MPAATVEYKQGMDYGVGIDTPSADARNACVAGDPSDIHGAAGDTVTFQMTEVTSIEDIQSALGITASASAGVGLFSASAKMNYTESCHFHSSSVFLMVSINVLQAFTSIKAPTISPAAAALLDAGQADRFQEQYGDMFVRGLVTGGQFFGVIEVSSSSKTDQESLSVSLSGSYGLFNASGSVSQSFSKAIENRSVKVSCFIQGGQTSPVPTSVEDMVAAARAWPGTLAGKGVPYSALLDSYSILALPNPPNYIDLQHQKDVLIECASLRNQDWFLMNEIDFMTAHPSQFIAPVDIPALTAYRNALAHDLNVIAAAASVALSDPKAAAVPTVTAVPMVLPQRVDGAPVEPPVMVQVPVWNSAEDIDNPGYDGSGHRVTGLTAAEAGLVVDQVLSTTGTASMGDILSIVPPPGTSVARGSTVTVTVQRNPGPNDDQ